MGNTYIIEQPDSPISPDTRSSWVPLIGAKAAGLFLLPSAWTPPYFVISTQLYKDWKAKKDDETPILGPISLRVSALCTRSLETPHGIILRSSATCETLADRGAYESREITADFNEKTIEASIEGIFRQFLDTDADGEIAIIVQIRQKLLWSAHISNELRVSSTINQWVLEIGTESDRFNSQRESPYPEDKQIEFMPSQRTYRLKLFQKIGRWCTKLESGRTHLEIGIEVNRLWILQIDFEEDQHDNGVDPRKIIRSSSQPSIISKPEDSPFELHTAGRDTPWRKLNNANVLAEGRAKEYPNLFFITGSNLLIADANGTDIEANLAYIGGNRLVCRTDCANRDIPSLNLPRTDTIGPREALDFMRKTISELVLRGSSPDQICFIIHRFIPAAAAAWVAARPDSQIVIVDALWGIPDGLQYLSHDSYEFDLKRRQLSAEHVRYKPKFLQETENGEWKIIDVARAATRSQVLGLNDIRDIAEHTYDVAKRCGEAVQVMWFCMTEGTNSGRNVPWFKIKEDIPDQRDNKRHETKRTKRRIRIEKSEDLKLVSNFQVGTCTFLLAPEVECIRSDGFLREVIDVATKYRCVIDLQGSILSHAYYILARSDVDLVTSTPTRTRSRQKQVFNKIVRDDLPARISEGGENTSLATISKGEVRTALIAKLFEEALELQSATSPNDVVAELADLLEVIRALCSATGVDYEDVSRAANQKRSIRGGFERGTVLLETSWPSSIKRKIEAPTKVSLKDISDVTLGDGLGIVNFPAALLGIGEINVKSDSNIRIKIGAKGVEIYISSENDKNIGEQLVLPL